MLITRKGHAKAIQQLQELREAVRRATDTAADMYHNAGDNWHDNPAWSDAVQKQDMIQGQLARLENSLKEQLVYIEDQEYDPDRVTPGKTVLIQDLDDNSEEEITILGPLESDPAEGIVSLLSPLANALIGSKTGDVVAMGSVSFLVKSIRYFES